MESFMRLRDSAIRQGLSACSVSKGVIDLCRQDIEAEGYFIVPEKLCRCATAIGVDACGCSPTFKVGWE